MGIALLRKLGSLRSHLQLLRMMEYIEIELSATQQVCYVPPNCILMCNGICVQHMSGELQRLWPQPMRR